MPKKRGNTQAKRGGSHKKPSQTQGEDMSESSTPMS